MTRLAEIEPRAMLFIQDEVRSSPLLFYSTVLDAVFHDVGRLSGIRHDFFGQEAGSDLHALNPGYAKGLLHARPNLAETEEFDSQGIYVLPETVAELPLIAGIITFGTGNPLSHVQMLARNLGIPNVSVSPLQVDTLNAMDQQSVILAVSGAGRVELKLDDAGTTGTNSAVQHSGQAERIQIQPDLGKLDTTLNEIVFLENLSVADSGRIVGPKAAKLGELSRRYPQAVARGMAIPFGTFKGIVLDQPHRSGTTIFEWAQQNYRRFDQ